MPKTKEELTQLKTEYETLNNKLKELSDDELKTVVGGTDYWLGMEALTEGFWYTTSIYPRPHTKSYNTIRSSTSWQWTLSYRSTFC